MKRSSRSPHRRDILMVGVGGVGVWAAVALAAALGDRLHLRLWDCDWVAPENLNRQTLFTEADATERAPKAYAALRSLGEIFPDVQLSSVVGRIGLEHADQLKALSPRPDAIFSAVDNAASRLVLQQLGRELRMPVIQGGTSLFSADCFTQTVAGPTLDEQMHGALSVAAAREGQVARRGGGCTVDPSYVVPGMVAGAFMAYRLSYLESEASVPPIRWRMGWLHSDSGATSHEIELGILDRLAELVARATAAR